MNNLIAFVVYLLTLIFGNITPTLPEAPIPTPTPRQAIQYQVPFSSQAPNYDWKDPRLQDACEETSVLMAYYWAKSLPLNSSLALKEILSMVDFQKENYSDYRDTSLADTADRLLRNYYSYYNFEVINNISPAQIIDQIYQKNLIIVPMNGQLLNNPNYTGHGPERHMLLIIGYDPETQEFITNDAGTRKGANYRYPEDVLFSAIRDYPTGYHIPITNIVKSMIVISRLN